MQKVTQIQEDALDIVADVNEINKAKAQSNVEEIIEDTSTN